jgi:hypothetical protein
MRTVSEVFSSQNVGRPDHDFPMSSCRILDNVALSLDTGFQFAYVGTLRLIFTHWQTVN